MNANHYITIQSNKHKVHARTKWAGRAEKIRTNNSGKESRKNYWKR